MRSVPARSTAVAADITEKLRAAWMALNPPADLTDALGQNALDKIVGQLVMVASGGGNHIDGRQFRRASHATSVAELELLAEILDFGPALRAAIDRLHKPAIVALADRHILREGLERYAVIGKAIVAEIERAKALIPAHTARSGRPPDKRALVVAGMVIAGYEELFGDAARTKRGLTALVTEIFNIMEIKASPRSVIGAARKARERTRAEIAAALAAEG